MQINHMVVCVFVCSYKNIYTIVDFPIYTIDFYLPIFRFHFGITKVCGNRSYKHNMKTILSPTIPLYFVYYWYSRGTYIIQLITL